MKNTEFWVDIAMFFFLIACFIGGSAMSGFGIVAWGGWLAYKYWFSDHNYANV